MLLILLLESNILGRLARFFGSFGRATGPELHLGVLFLWGPSQGSETTKATQTDRGPTRTALPSFPGR